MPRLFAKIFLTAALAATLFVPARAQRAADPSAAALLPDRVGVFTARGPANAENLNKFFMPDRPEDFDAVSGATRVYFSPDGESLSLWLIKTGSEGAAYSLLTRDRTDGSEACDVGTACVKFNGAIDSFVKGSVYVSISMVGNIDGKLPTPEQRMDFARALAETLDAGSGGLPPLVLHLPEWERAETFYAVSLPALQAAAGGRPALEAVSFEGGAEAAVASYGQTRLVIVEHTTPQYAQDTDARVTERIAQLRAENRPVPDAYRRVGNYTVFVFDAGNEAEAAGLVEQVKYEKDVRWLGDNPHAAEKMQEQYTQTMGGVILATLKTTGLAILLCLGVGGLFGGMVFLRRRAQATAAETYSDAGGMLRLNIEDVNAPHGPARLLSDGEK